MPYLLDADWAINALAGRAETVTALTRLAPEGIAISLVTVAELYEGAFGSRDPERHLRTLRSFLGPFARVSLNDPIAERFAQVRSLLRSRGDLIPDFDILIGATALHYDLTVLTDNVRHLGRIPGLGVYQRG